MYITDGRQTATVALWGDHAYRFEAEKCMKLAEERPIVLLFCRVTSGWFNGELSLQASPTCTWYVDPEIPEAKKLRDRNSSMINPNWAAKQQAGRSDGPATVAQLALIEDPHEAFGNTYTVTVVVRSILSNRLVV